MEFNRARRIGDHGEQQVSERLRTLAPRYGFEYRDKVLLSRGKVTAECDHILVDRFGILIIETKVRNAAILGTSTDKTWTAMYHGKNKTFQNPLLQNMQHQSIVRQVLSDAGEALSPDQVRRAVVFVGADLSRLELEAADKYRVKEIRHIEQILSGRDSFPPNNGCLGPSDVTRIAALIDRLNRTGQVDVETAHAAYRGGPIPSQPVARAASASAASMPAQVAQTRPKPRAMELSGRHYETEFNWRPLAYVAAGLLAIVFLVWLAVAIGLGVARVSTVGWLVVLGAATICVAILTPSGTRGGRRRSRSARSTAEGGLGTRIIALAFAGLMFGGLYLFFVTGAANRVIQVVVTMMVPSSVTVLHGPSVTPGTAVVPGIPVAKARLRESNPTVYSAASNLDAPKMVSNPGGSTSYTWNYTQRVSAAVVKPVAYTLTLDAQGCVIGVNSTP